MSGIVALAVMAFLSLGSLGFPGMFGSLERGDALILAQPPPMEMGLRADELGEAPDDGLLVSGGEGFAPSYAIHVASFRVMTRAETLANTLREKVREPVRISLSESDTGLWYRVLVGSYPTRGEAIDRMPDLKDRHGLTFLRPVRVSHPEEDTYMLESSD
jgi:hypothetical protein